jgi:CHAT domain-containing protein
VREAVQARAGLGRVEALSGCSEEADAHLAEAARAYRALEQPTESARLDLIRAEIALARGAHQDARSIALRAVETLRDRPADACVARYHLARAALAAGELGVAEEALGVAVPAAERLGITPLVADLLHTRGLLQRAAGLDAEAVSSFRMAVDNVERIRGALQAERFRAAFHGNRLAIYEDLVTAALDQADGQSLADAFAGIERAKSRSLLDLAQGALDTVDLQASDEADAVEAGIIGELGRLRAELNARYSRLADESFAGRESAATGVWQEEIAARERQIESLESRLATARGVAGLYRPPVDLAGVQALVTSDTALVEYFVAGGELLALVVRGDSVRVFRRLARVEELSDRVRRMHFQIRRALRPGATEGLRGKRLVQDARRELQALFEILVDPLKGAFGGARRLLIVPHGILHTVPFHALWDGQRYLVESHELAYAPSASLLASLGGPTVRDAAGDRSLVLGVSDERAPYIESEVRQVAAALNAPHPHRGAEATVARLKQGARRAEIIHVACHGHFSAQHARSSGLKLADRWLSLGEICELSLRSPLVTLSGCETGRNVIGTGDELLGLVRGFIAAGAAALVVSLWTVNDKSTGHLMSCFYNQIAGLREDFRMMKALRAAQLELMAARPHPAIWAPFILIGAS